MMGGKILTKPSARFYVDQRLGGYTVVDSDGRAICPVLQFRHLAERERAKAQEEADRKSRRGKRNCLCCGKPFDSEGIHHRMCTPCRGRTESDQSQRPIITMRRSA